MQKMNYESPELDIRWFESEDVIAVSQPVTEGLDGDGFAPNDEW